MCILGNDSWNKSTLDGTTSRVNMFITYLLIHSTDSPIKITAVPGQKSYESSSVAKFLLIKYEYSEKLGNIFPSISQRIYFVIRSNLFEDIKRKLTL